MGVIFLRDIGIQPNKSVSVDLDLSDPRPHNQQIVQVLETLLDSAKTGQLVGIVFGLMLASGKTFVEVAGAARSDPINARGVVRCIDDELALLVHTGADRATTI